MGHVFSSWPNTSINGSINLTHWETGSGHGGSSFWVGLGYELPLHLPCGLLPATHCSQHQKANVLGA